MRILMLHNRYLTPGGEDQCTAAEVQLLSDHGHYVELLEQDNRTIEHMGNLRAGIRTLWSWDSYNRIYEKLRAGSFDVMHVQNFFPLWSPSVYYAASHCSVPVIQTLHNYRLMCVNATLYREHHVCEECIGRIAPWPGIVHACYRESRAASAVLAGMTGFHKMLGTWKRRVQLYIALTGFARDKFIAGGFPAEKIVIKPNFVHPSPACGPGGGGYALFVGRLSPEKGITAMLEAWRLAKNPLTLKVVGDGPLTDTVKEAVLSTSSIQYLGRRAYGEVLELMGRAEFLVFPSEWFEGMPRTVIESFAVGTPVIAARIGAAASMVEHGKTGLHFVPGDVSDLCTQVERCSGNLDIMRAMRGKARAEFEARYTGSANADLLINIYNTAAENKRAAAS